MYFLWMLHVGCFWSAAALTRPHVPTWLQAQLIIFNQGVVTLSIVGLCSRLFSPLPTFTNHTFFIWKFILAGILHAVSFFSVHRYLLHRQFWPIHRLHHTAQQTVSWDALLVHPIEHVISNLVPVMLGPLILRMTYEELQVWVCLSTLQAVYSHQSERFHKLHHVRPHVNYGVTGILDYVAGTYA